MRIDTFSYENKAIEWRLETISFSDLTLLVGVSGVGKTQILKAILNVKAIAEGKPRNGVSWEISFRSKDGKSFIWSGEFENKEHVVDAEFEFSEEDGPKTREQPNILREKLICNGEIIVNRTRDEILLRGTATPKLSPYNSILHLLANEDDVAPASHAFQRIVYSDQTFRDGGYRLFDLKFDRIMKRYDTVEKIRESNLDTTHKLAIVFRSAPELFNQIRERFLEIFPHVTDLKVEPREEEDAPPFVSEIPVIQIKEKGVSNWIDQRKISSGMLRTILHISEMYLWPMGTVILIDEFENSLGVNCIDVLTEDLIQQNRNLQFIVTSHHPYIINNIGPKFWKIVRRNGGMVSTIDASSLGLSESSHQAFIQLINNDSYRDGIGN